MLRLLYHVAVVEPPAVKHQNGPAVAKHVGVNRALPGRELQMNEPTPADRLYRICEEGLCIGCGLCAAIAGTDAVQIAVTPEGALRPIAGPALDHATVDRIYETCPGTRLEGLPAHEVDRDTEVDAVWGPFQQIVKAHATDPEVRFKAAAGGVLTALAIYLLESGKVDCVLHATASQEQPSFGVRQISRDRAEVLRGAGSRYGPTATLIDIDRLVDVGRPFAFVGTPCDVTALRNLARVDPRVDALCRMMMAPVCGGFMETPALARRLAEFGVDFDRLAALRYRGHGCPGPTHMEEIDGRVVEKTYLDFWGEDESAWSLPWRCKVCADGIGEAADIAASDVWPGGAPSRAQAADHSQDPGANGVLVRSARGLKLIEDAVRDGAVVVTTARGTRDMDVWQPHQVRRKRAVWARYEGMRLAGHLVPATARLRLCELYAENPPEENAAETEGSRRRVEMGKASEPRPRPADRPKVTRGS